MFSDSIIQRHMTSDCAMRSLFSEEAIEYAWQQLAIIAGVDVQDSVSGNGFESLPLDLRYGYETGGISEGKLQVRVRACTSSAWRRLIQGEAGIKWIPISELVPARTPLPFDDAIPVVLWGRGAEDGNRPFVELSSNGSVLLFNADIVATTFFMLSRWEETVNPERDEHSRFPASASIAYKYSFLDRPIVDEYAVILKMWLKSLLPDWKPIYPHFNVQLSHDIDAVRKLSSWPVMFRYLIGDLLYGDGVASDARSIFKTIRGRSNPEQDPFMMGIEALAELSRAQGLRSAFYFKTAQQGPRDSGYDFFDPLVQKCIERLRRENFEIGFHPGYDTFKNLDRLLEEKADFDTAVGNNLDGYGGRQHYLRFESPITWRHWEAANLAYDSTMGYADREGFRCGTCHPFHPFDFENNRVLDLVEVPLIVMEKVFLNRGISQAEEAILKLAKQCQKVGGTFTLLWHNSSVFGNWRHWFKMYESVVTILAEMCEGINA